MAAGRQQVGSSREKWRRILEKEDVLEKDSRNLEKTNGVRRTWSKFENRKRNVCGEL